VEHPVRRLLVWLAAASASHRRVRPSGRIEKHNVYTFTDTVDPIRLTSGVHSRHPSGFGAGAILTHAWQHGRVSTQNYFKAPACATSEMIRRDDGRALFFA